MTIHLKQNRRDKIWSWNSGQLCIYIVWRMVLWPQILSHVHAKLQKMVNWNMSNKTWTNYVIIRESRWRSGIILPIEFATYHTSPTPWLKRSHAWPMPQEKAMISQPFLLIWFIIMIKYICFFSLWGLLHDNEKRERESKDDLLCLGSGNLGCSKKNEMKTDLKHRDSKQQKKNPADKMGHLFASEKSFHRSWWWWMDKPILYKFLQLWD